MTEFCDVCGQPIKFMKNIAKCPLCKKLVCANCQSQHKIYRIKCASDYIAQGFGSQCPFKMEFCDGNKVDADEKFGVIFNNSIANKDYRAVLICLDCVTKYNANIRVQDLTVIRKNIIDQVWPYTGSAWSYTGKEKGFWITSLAQDLFEKKKGYPPAF